MIKGISLRRADINDVDLLYAWANDMEVRMNSFSKEDFSYDDHIRWLKDKLADDRCAIYIAYRFLEPDPADEMDDVEAMGFPGAESISVKSLRSEEPIGQIRLDIDADGIADIDYSVDYFHRGQGLGKELLSRIERLYDPRIKAFRGRVVLKNKASHAAFLSCGYEKGTPGEKNKIAYEEYIKSTSTGTRSARRILICAIKSWNAEYAREFQNKFKGIYEVEVITDHEELTLEKVDSLSPEYIFFPHWSHIIPKSIYSKYNCVIFHMTDLPFGRGGSPLQNLIVRGYKETMISALKAEKDLDAGPIYMKEALSLKGTAQEILIRASGIIFRNMIPRIIEEGMEPSPQEGQVACFDRRKPEDGEIIVTDIEDIYDRIRMLDAEGYPRAFVKIGEDTRVEFHSAVLDEKTGELRAQVVIKRLKKM